MSANLFENTGFFNGATWHSMGVYSDEPHTALQALAKSSSDVNFTTAPLFAVIGNSTIQVKNSVAVVLEPHGDKLEYTPIGVVSDHYSLLQNQQIAQAIEPLSEQWPVSSMFSLGKGGIFCIVLKAQSFEVNGDVINAFFTVVERHDGKGGTKIIFTPERAVCQNTLRIAEKLSVMNVVIRHSVGNDVYLENLSGTMMSLIEQQKAISSLFSKMGTIPVSLGDFKNMLDSLVPVSKQDNKEKLSKEEKLRSQLTQAFGQFNDEFPAYGQTGWAAYNAFTQVLTHSKPERGPQNVVNSLLFGQRAQLAQKAFAYVLK